MSTKIWWELLEVIFIHIAAKNELILRFSTNSIVLNIQKNYHLSVFLIMIMCYNEN